MFYFLHFIFLIFFLPYFMIWSLFNSIVETLFQLFLLHLHKFPCPFQHFFLHLRFQLYIIQLPTHSKSMLKTSSLCSVVRVFSSSSALSTFSSTSLPTYVVENCNTSSHIYPNSQAPQGKHEMRVTMWDLISKMPLWKIGSTFPELTVNTEWHMITLLSS